MILSFDKFERYELPQVTLCNPNSRATEVDGKITITDTVGVLSNPKGMNLKLNFNAPHELSFDYYRHKSTDPIKQLFYDKICEAIQTDRYIYLTNIGYFVISSVTDSDEDNIDKKSISLKSCEENELATAEGLHLKEGTYYLHTDNNDGLLDLFLPKTAGWTMGYIDPSLLTKPYFVEDIEVDNGYNFLYTTIQDMFECIVEPDIIKRTISVYSRVYYAEHHLTDVHIAKYNLLKHKIVEENDEDKYTALNVQGKDENLEIRAVNPTGKNVIYNFEPRYSWMSPALQQAIEKWQEKCESVEEEYLTLQQGYYTEQELVFNKQKDIEVLELGLKQLESTRDFITSGAADNYLENIKLYCAQYNSNVNGNVDYAKRPFISPEEMVSSGYPEFSNPDEEVATTYDCDYAFMNGSGSVLYTIKMTPIKEDRTVLSVEGLDAYYDAMASSCSSKEQLIAYDAAHSKLIINIANGDTPRDSEGLTALDKTLMPIKNNHWATVKAFMNGAGLDMNNLSNLLNEIENAQTALNHVNDAIAAKQVEINTATANYNTHKETVRTTYEVPIAQINSDCALDLTAKDINGNSIFTTELLNELMTHIKPTDYVDEYMLVTESMTYPQRFEKAKELMDRAQSQLVKISSGQKIYSIDTRSFLFNRQFKHFSEQLCAGAIIYVETKSDTMEQLHLTGIDINFDEKSTSFTLGNKYDRSDLKALYDDALGQNSKSFSELKYIVSIIEDQQKQLDFQRNWVADLRTLTLDNVLTSEDQAIEINNRGLIGRKRKLKKNGEWDFDVNGNPLFELEQVKLINNTLVFTEDNWNTASTAVGKIAVGYNDDGSVKYAYGINGQVLIGELILGNNLVLTGTGAGIKIKDGNGKDAFYADDDGNLVLSGKITATTGSIGGWEIRPSYLCRPGYKKYDSTKKTHIVDKYGIGFLTDDSSGTNPAFYAGYDSSKNKEESDVPSGSQSWREHTAFSIAYNGSVNIGGVRSLDANGNQIYNENGTPKWQALVHYHGVDNVFTIRGPRGQDVFKVEGGKDDNGIPDGTVSKITMNADLIDITGTLQGHVPNSTFDNYKEEADGKFVSNKKSSTSSSVTGWEINDNHFAIYGNNNNYTPVFSVNGDGSATFKGTVNATGGKIGNWNMDSYKLWKPVVWNGGLSEYGTGMSATSNAGDPAFYAGFAGNEGNPWGHEAQKNSDGTTKDGPWTRYANFYVLNDGTMKANRGTIGNLNINTDGSINNSSTAGKTVSHNRIFRGSYSGKTFSNYGSTSAWYNYEYKLPIYKVDTNVTITLSANTSSHTEYILTTNNVQGNGSITELKHTTSASSITWTYLFRANTQYYLINNRQSSATVNSVTVTPVSGGFSITANGVLTCTNATITGKITATSGKFTNCTIDKTCTITKIEATEGSVGGWNIYNNATYGGYCLQGYKDSHNWVLLTPNNLYGSDAGYVRHAPWYNIAVTCETGSDKNIKDNILNIDEKYDKVFDSLQPSTFNYSDDVKSQLHFGFVAQDVLKSFSDIDVNNFAGLWKTEHYNLNKQEFIALNTWQIQKAKARITELENRVAELKTQIQTLTAG